MQDNDGTRSILRLSGADTEDFLQGLITNDIARLENGLVYAALLTPQGKYIADFFLFRAGDAVCLDVDASLADALVKRLTMYKLRADVTVEVTDLKLRRGVGHMPEGAFADPRHPDLGWRSYGADADDGETDWVALRVALGVPETGIELSGDTFILEAGFERLNGVDFKKGCYVGQEVTARMKHKTELRKGLARVRVEGEAPAGTEIVTADGKPAGTLFSQADGKGIAYLRFDRAQGEMTAGTARVVREQAEG